jgi:hypothetical protein
MSIYPHCPHTPPCYNGVGPCYQAAAEKHFPLNRGPRREQEVTPAELEEIAHHIVEDANKIYDLLAATGMTDAEWWLLRDLAEGSMPPRTYVPKGDDLI